MLEALGAGLRVDADTAVTHAALRTSSREGDRPWITGRTGRSDDGDAAALLVELDPLLTRLGIRLQALGGRCEALLTAPGHPDADVTDSDPFFETFHPWLRPVPTGPQGAAFAETLTGGSARRPAHLVTSEVNTGRHRRGLPALDVLTTKWSGVRRDIPSFIEQIGVAEAEVPSTRLYRGLAAVLGMDSTHLPPVDDLEKDLGAHLDAVEDLLAGGARFVHVHTKATDEAGHTKEPYAKRDVLEEVDRGLAGLADLAGQAIVAVTG